MRANRRGAHAARLVLLALFALLRPLLAVAAEPQQAPAPEASGPPRRSYNQARAAFSGKDLAKAEAGFLAARDRAEGDDELRFRAAFNLALTHAQKAAGLGKEKPQEALSALQQSAAWFRDAVRLHPEDPDARRNLEIVLRRMQQLSDQLNKGQNALEARLMRVIQDERTLRDRIRGLLGRINQSGAAAEPLGFQGEFEDASTFQRTLLSDAGAILDLAGDERDQLSRRAEKDRSPEDEGRLVQLQNLEHYLNLARGTMADVGRLLRRLQGDRSHRQADLALTQLKRALEQLQDPVTVLKGLAADQTGALGQTRALDEIRARGLQLGAQKAVAPPWLTPAHLTEQQKELRPRTRELLLRLEAGVEHEAKNPHKPDPNKPADPREEAQRKRLLEGARQAIPLVKEAAQAMEQADGALATEELTRAAKAQVAALAALFKALERFSGLRDLIELAYGEQSQLVGLLSPEGKAQLEKLPPAERGAIFTDGVAHNQDRIGRMKGLISDELQALQAPQAPGPPGQGGGKDEAEKRAAEKQRYELAEQKRQLAEVAIGQLLTLLAQKGADLRPTAEEGRKHLEDLRRLFFSIVEHLKELLRNQTETHDKTGSAQAQKDEAERQRRRGPLAEAEAGHAAMGKALGEALAAQADQAGSAKEPQAQEAQKQLAEAAEEVKKAHGAMSSASSILKDSQDPGQGQSLLADMEPALEQQKQAIAHLEAAIRILEPPQEKQQQQDKNQKQDEQQQLSQEQAARRLQAIREREAERQRKQQQPSRPEPVEKDW